MGDILKGLLDRFLVTGGFDLHQLGDLLLSNRAGNFQIIFQRLILDAVFVNAYDHIQALVDAGLFTGRGLFDAHFGHAGHDGFGHAAQLFDLGDDFARLFGNGVGQPFHIIRSAQGIRHMTNL